MDICQRLSGTTWNGNVASSAIPSVRSDGRPGFCFTLRHMPCRCPIPALSDPGRTGQLRALDGWSSNFDRGYQRAWHVNVHSFWHDTDISQLTQSTTILVAPHGPFRVWSQTEDSARRDLAKQKLGRNNTAEKQAKEEPAQRDHQTRGVLPLDVGRGD